MHLVHPSPQKNCVHRWKRSFEFIINWKKWSGKILGVNKVPYGRVKNWQLGSLMALMANSARYIHSKKIVGHQVVEGSTWCHCWIVLYLMSRFFLITAQTREFPTILVMISTDVTTVTAISADSDMTMSVLVTITEIICKKTVSNNLGKVLPRTLCIKRTFSGSSPPRVCTWVGSFDRTYVAATIKWLLNGKGLFVLYTRG